MGLYQSYGIANHQECKQGDRKRNPDREGLNGSFGLALVLDQEDKSAGEATNDGKQNQYNEYLYNHGGCLVGWSGQPV